jgi:hypothetical protein
LENKELQHFSPLSTTFPHLPPLWAYFGLGQAFICVFVQCFQVLTGGEKLPKPYGDLRPIGSKRTNIKYFSIFNRDFNQDEMVSKSSGNISLRE